MAQTAPLFEIRLPLDWIYPGGCRITFDSADGDRLPVGRGLYFLEGDNGSGKTTLLNLLALTAGWAGSPPTGVRGDIAFRGRGYRQPDFSPRAAAALRESSFAIFPQKAFFLPVSIRDHYRLLRGTAPPSEDGWPTERHPEQLSGGQQQRLMMDLVLDARKPVWFLDEPLTHMDADRRHAFWRLLDGAWRAGLCTAMLIDHALSEAVRSCREFSLCGRLTTRTGDGRRDEQGRVNVYRNARPDEFVHGQIHPGRPARARREEPAGAHRPDERRRIL